MAAPINGFHFHLRSSLVLKSYRLRFLSLLKNRNFHSSPCCRYNITEAKGRGLVLGVFEPAEVDAQSESEGQFIFTPISREFNQKTKGHFENILKIAGKKLKCGESRLLYGIDNEFPVVAVSNLGKIDVGYDCNEQLDQGKENIRAAIAAGVRALRDAGENKVAVDSCGDAEAAAEGSALCLYKFDHLKAAEKRVPLVDTKVLTSKFDNFNVTETDESWSKGQSLANGQNFARYLKDNPSNKMTPTIFCEEVKNQLGILPNVKLTAHDKKWAESKKMGAFLSVSRGSGEPLKFLEIDYDGGKPGDAPVAFVGKGITFDSGGISIKPSSGMDQMRADMGGAAAVVGSIQAAASLRIPLNVKGLIPLCENMPSGVATKPGDVVTAMNGKTIQVDNTDAEGRLVLADALCYAETFSPRLILDVATLTGAIVIALGNPASAAYTQSESIWKCLHDAGKVTGDRMWRMPLFKHYTKAIQKSDLADLNNISGSREAGSCTAAAFLQEFVTTKEWVHLDICGVMSNKTEVPYLGKGMSGRPSRTLTKFLENISA